MGLETGNLPDDLVEANPVGATDPVSQGDDHIRLIKTVIKNWGGTWGGDQVDTLAKAYADAGDATLQSAIDANTAAIATKADLDGAALTNATLDGNDILTDQNYPLKALTVVETNTTPSLPTDNNKFLPVTGNVTISGTAVQGHRLDILNIGTGSITVTGGTFSGLGNVAGGLTLTIPVGFGASMVYNGTLWYVIGTGSIA